MIRFTIFVLALHQLDAHLHVPDTSISLLQRSVRIETASRPEPCHECDSISLKNNRSSNLSALSIDELTNATEHKPEKVKEEHEPHVALLFLWFAITAGSIANFFQVRFFPGLPYTVLLFALGCLVSIHHEYLDKESPWVWEVFFKSVHMWQNISPHLMFYVFLPALVFSDAIKLNVALVRRCFGQVLLLAGPGVVIGTVLIGVFAKFVFPYAWSWSICMAVGAILSATDPVAVVSLFGSLGISPRLTMVIAGESLLNDGTAMVAFSLMLKGIEGTSMSLAGAVSFFLNMTVLGILEGIVLGGMGVFCIQACSCKTADTDAMLQLMVLIALSYLTFFLAETALQTSGVVALVCAGYVVARSSWQKFVTVELISGVWETLEFMGNTLIFMLAGLLFGGAVLSSVDTLELVDLGYLILLYLASTLIRGFMIAVLWVPINSCGYSLTFGDALVMTWSGLRGAVSLALAIIMANNKAIGDVNGRRVIFHVGGMAMLTMFINATTCGPLLQYLGMTSESLSAKLKVAHVRAQMRGHGEEVVAKLKQNRLLSTHDMTAIQGMLPTLQSTPTPTSTDPISDEEFFAFCRHQFMEVVKCKYKSIVASGWLPGYSFVATVLADAALESELDPQMPLADWQALEDHFCFSRLWQIPSQLMLCKPFGYVAGLRETFPTDEVMNLWKVYAVVCFLQAHAAGREELSDIMSYSKPEKRIIDKVVEESAQQDAMANKYLGQVPEETVLKGKNNLCALKVLSDQQKLLTDLCEQGYITESEQSELISELAETRFKVYYGFSYSLPGK